MKRILCAVCCMLAVPAGPAGALEIEKDRTVAVLWAAVAARSLNVRASPSTDAKVEFQLPRGAYVAIVEELGQPARLTGKRIPGPLLPQKPASMRTAPC